MKQLIFRTTNSYSPTLLRFFLGFVLLAHGAQKLLGWFGGFGFRGTMNFFTDSVGLPWIVGFLVIVIEFFGSLSLLLGFATRLWSLAVMGLMAGVVITSHWQNGFFMNWFGNQAGEGIEYFLLVIAMAGSLVISGSGRLSLDAFLNHHWSRKQAGPTAASKVKQGYIQAA